MTFGRPTPDQERWMAVASRLSVDRDMPWLSERIGGWKAVTSFARCAFFILGLVAAGLMVGILSLMHVPAYLLVSGLCLVVVAEWLVLERRCFGIGIDEALEVVGLLMIVLQVVDQIDDRSGIHISLLIAIALAVAGFRLLNPLFITLSAIALSCTINYFDAQHLVTHMPPASMARAFCFAVAFLALLICGAEIRRPSYDQMLNWLIVTMPLAGYLWIASDMTLGPSIDSLRTTAVVRLLPMLMLMSFGITALVLGLRRRTHAPMMSFMVCVACVAYELRSLTTLSLQLKLICWGSVVLLVTIALDRYLRTPRCGITSNPFAENKGPLDLLQLAGASALAPPSIQPSDAPLKGGGGTFGGGGASRSY